MPIKDIKEYLELTLRGDETIHQRLELVQKQKQLLQEQMASLQRTLDVLDYNSCMLLMFFYNGWSSSEGTYLQMSGIVQFKILHKSFMVVIEMCLLFFNRLKVESEI